MGTVILVEFPGGVHQADAFPVIFEVEVNYPSNRVRAVLGGRAVAKHLNALDGGCGDRCQVRALGTGAANRHQRCAVAALAVHQHEGVVRGQITQGGRPDEGRAIADRLPRHVVGRHQGLHKIVEIGLGRPFDHLSVENIHRHGGIRRTSRLTTKTSDNNLLYGLFGQRDGRHGEGSACRCNRNCQGQNLKIACLHTFNSQLGEPSSGPGPVRFYDHCS